MFSSASLYRSAALLPKTLCSSVLRSGVSKNFSSLSSTSITLGSAHNDHHHDDHGHGHGHGHEHSRPLDPNRDYPNGFLFGEKPGPRKWENWEAIWYSTVIGGFVLFGVGWYYKQDKDPRAFARKIALERLYAQNPDVTPPSEETTTTAAAHH